MTQQQPSDLTARLWKVVLVAFGVVAYGTVGFKLLNFLAQTAPHPDKSFTWNEASWLDCLYQTFIFLSTLGIEQKVPVSHLWQGKVFMITLMVSGASMAAYALTTLTAFVVEGELSQLLGRRRMDREIARLRNHHIVCGAGRTGAIIINELVTTKRGFVVIDTDEARLKELAANTPILYVVGDAHEEEVLRSAGLDRATGLLATLGSDRDNLYLVITARQLNPQLRIIARGYELSAREKLVRAGADNVIYPNFIGGMRMVSEMVRPEAVNFLDRMLREAQRPLRVEQVIVREGSALIGKTLGQSQIREKTGLLVVACREDNQPFVDNPTAETVIRPGMALVVLGEVEQLPPLREMAGES